MVTSNSSNYAQTQSFQGSSFPRSPNCWGQQLFPSEFHRVGGDRVSITTRYSSNTFKSGRLSKCSSSDKGNIFFETNTKSTIGETMGIFFNELAENNCSSNNSGLRGAFQNSPPPSVKVTKEEKIIAC